jgi:putative effector of murein hydrolase
MEVLKGIVGAIVFTPITNHLGFRDWRQRGFTIGHSIWNQNCPSLSNARSSFCISAAAMALNGLFTALVNALFSQFISKLLTSDLISLP